MDPSGTQRTSPLLTRWMERPTSSMMSSRYCIHNDTDWHHWDHWYQSSWFRSGIAWHILYRATKQRQGKSEGVYWLANLIDPKWWSRSKFEILGALRSIWGFLRYTISVPIQIYRSELYKSGGALPPYSKSRGAIAPPSPPTPCKSC